METPCFQLLLSLWGKEARSGRLSIVSLAVVLVLEILCECMGGLGLDPSFPVNRTWCQNERGWEYVAIHAAGSNTRSKGLR